MHCPDPDRRGLRKRMPGAGCAGQAVQTLAQPPACPGQGGRRKRMPGAACRARRLPPLAPRPAHPGYWPQSQMPATGLLPPETEPSCLGLQLPQNQQLAGAWAGWLAPERAASLGQPGWLVPEWALPGWGLPGWEGQIQRAPVRLQVLQQLLLLLAGRQVCLPGPPAPPSRSASSRPLLPAAPPGSRGGRGRCTAGSWPRSAAREGAHSSSSRESVSHCQVGSAESRETAGTQCRPFQLKPSKAKLCGRNESRAGRYPQPRVHSMIGRAAPGWSSALTRSTSACSCWKAAYSPWVSLAVTVPKSMGRWMMVR